jgi:glycosyltransferase involved in cell wall biosynthesis
MKKHIVFSAINIYQSGMLTIAREFLARVCQTPAFQAGNLHITLFCHRTQLYADLAQPGVMLIEKPLSRKNWGVRLFYEYAYFWAWSLKHNVDMWVSLHDVSPNVRAARRVVYCHNPMPFYRGKMSARYDLKLKLFQWLYTFNYQTNLHKNWRIIVQQQWLREAFVQSYVCDPAKIIVALPTSEHAPTIIQASQPAQSADARVLIYPTFPRPYKNYEVLLDAMRLLTDVPIRLKLTIAPDVNAYAHMLCQRYADLPNVEFVGFCTRDQVERMYATASAMVFPSKSETWGLAMSEFRHYDKPIFSANLPYAKETLSGYPLAAFFEPDDATALATALHAYALNGEFRATPTHTDYAPPFAQNWGELIHLLELG